MHCASNLETLHNDTGVYITCETHSEGEKIYRALFISFHTIIEMKGIPNDLVINWVHTELIMCQLATAEWQQKVANI